MNRLIGRLGCACARGVRGGPRALPTSCALHVSVAVVANQGVAFASRRRVFLSDQAFASKFSLTVQSRSASSSSTAHGATFGKRGEAALCPRTVTGRRPQGSGAALGGGLEDVLRGVVDIAVLAEPAEFNLFFGREVSLEPREDTAGMDKKVAIARRREA